MKWQKIPRREYAKVEAYLKKREIFCVAACSRYLGINETRQSSVWRLPGKDNEISALILHSRRVLFPLFNTDPHIPAPHFLKRFLGKMPVHAIQGLNKDAELLESLMKNYGYFAAQRIDYTLMTLDEKPRPETFRVGPSALILRTHQPQDEEALFELQSAYEKEEVIPVNSVFNPAVCRLNLQKLLSREHVLVAELDGKIVGKINSSARSFSRYQVGGVYVRPEYRSLGIGLKMSVVFSQHLLEKGRGLTLFVKKHNTAAVKIYRKAGYTTLADYRITYF